MRQARRWCSMGMKGGPLRQQQSVGGAGTGSSAGESEQREPSEPSVPQPTPSMSARGTAEVLAGAHSSTTDRPSTKHSGTLLPALRGTQSSSRLSLQHGGKGHRRFRGCPSWFCLLACLPSHAGDPGAPG